jgi:hypothetical protein
MKFCLACEAEYTDWITTCSDCGAQLVESSSEDEPERVVYEVGTWPLSLQAAAAQAMAESGIPHEWIGADLAIMEEHEEAVDAILDDVEKGAGLQKEAGVGELAYDLEDWTDAQRATIQQSLLTNSIPYRWEGETSMVLVVRADDEDKVDDLLDGAEFGDDVDTGMAPELMSELFVAADQLRKDPNDGDAMDSLATHLDTMALNVPPFGIETLVWKKIVESANGLSDTIVDEEASSEAVKAKAGALRDLLHPYV